MRPRPGSQSGRILSLLEEGGWWSTSDLLRQVPSIVHSRIAGLREAGYVIEHKTTGQGAAHSLYRLVVASTAGDSGLEPSPAVLGAHSSDAPSPQRTGVESPQTAPVPLSASSEGRRAPLGAEGLATHAASESHSGPSESAEPLTLFGDERSHYAKEEAA